MFGWRVVSRLDHFFPGAGTVDRPSWAPTEVDVTRPSVARVYDFYLGGSHNFASDRAFAREVLRVYPELTTISRDNRDFLRRVVLFLCSQGVDQFLDLGSGIPTVGNVHEVAQTVNPQARVVYVDHDPVAVTHSRALLADTGGVVAISGDLREPRPCCGKRCAGRFGFGPAGGGVVRLGAAFRQRPARPAELVAEYMNATVPGSYVAISHAAVTASGTRPPPRRCTTGPARRIRCGSAPPPRSVRCSGI